MQPIKKRAKIEPVKEKLVNKMAVGEEMNISWCRTCLEAALLHCPRDESENGKISVNKSHFIRKERSFEN